MVTVEFEDFADIEFWRFCVYWILKILQQLDFKDFVDIVFWGYVSFWSSYERPSAQFTDVRVLGFVWVPGGSILTRTIS